MNYICKKIEILYYLMCFVNYYLRSSAQKPHSPPYRSPESWLRRLPTHPRNQKAREAITTLLKLFLIYSRYAHLPLQSPCGLRLVIFATPALMCAFYFQQSPVHPKNRKDHFASTTLRTLQTLLLICSRCAHGPLQSPCGLRRTRIATMMRLCAFYFQRNRLHAEALGFDAFTAPLPFLSIY